MTRFIIFRHGQTDWNLERRVMGKTDIPLNNVGRHQAKKLAFRLQETCIDAFYSSPLKRAKETAEIVAASHDVPVMVLPELIELNLGQFEGKTKTERLELFPWFDATNDRHRKKLNMDTFDETVCKVKKILETLLHKHAYQTVALGTHDLKMRCLLLALGMPESIKGEVMKNSAISIVEKSNDGIKIICHNDNTHLEEI
ncbi:MAG: histidine phosphatase family protein [Patescibacteria group bacterium]|nr:histidine phosphatase family protein [Patescibacteria group bacterium]